MLLLIQQWTRWEPARVASQEQVVQLIDPKTLTPPETRKLIFGTDREEDLKSIPRGKETRLPPIPKSDRPGSPPAGRAGKPPGSSAAPTPPAAPPAPIAPSPSPAPSEQTTSPEGTLPAPGVPAPPSTEEVAKSLPSLPSVPFGGGRQGEGGTGSPSRPGGGGPGFPGAPGIPGVPGLPGIGLPFADAKSLDRLAKVFSDQEQAPPKDSISINTDDLKFFSYTLKLKNKIEYIWRYPQAAAERGIQGDLLLTFTIQRNGYVSEVRVVSTSGYEILDLEAVRAIKDASPFAPLPDSWNKDHITITGHFIYHNQFTYLR